MRTQYAYLATDQQIRPNGIRIVEPPPDTLQSARGRLYAVIEFGATTPEAMQRVEQALSTIQRTYYTIKGTQSYVLGEALREALQQLLVDENASDSNADLGILLVALLENRLMAVGTGAVIALFTNGGKVDVFPPGAIQFNESGEPVFDVYRQEAPVGCAFLLAGNYCLEYFSLRDLASTVAYLSTGNLAEIVNALCEHADIEQLPGLFVVTATDDATTPSTTIQATTPAPPLRRRWGGLPAALQAAPPARLHTATTDPAASEARLVASTKLHSPDSYLPYDPNDAGHEEEVTSNPALQTKAAGSSAPWRAIIQTAMGQTKAFLAKILPERTLPSAQTPLASVAVTPSQSTYAYQSTAAAAYPRGVPDPVVNPELDQPYAIPPAAKASGGRAGVLDQLATFKPPARATGSRARLYILLALLILILTPVVVIGVYWSRDMRNQEQAEQALDMAEASFLAAESALQTGDKATARIKLTDAQNYLVAADNLIGGRLTRADELSVRIEREMAELLQIQPLYALAAPLVQFVPDAIPQRVLVNDQDIYVLDVGRQVVQYFQFDPTRSMVTNLEGETVLRRGDTIEGSTVGELVDITWQPPIAGVQDKAYLLILDRSNTVFRYDRRVEGASRLALGGGDQLRAPVRMKVYADRLYIADQGANQLFRYAGDYSQPPAPWFDAQVQSDLGSLRAMDIDGDVWMLYEQGLVSRYRTGVQVPFSLEESIGPITGPVDIAVGDQGNSMVYIADGGQERILVYSKDGQYQRQFRAPEGHPLRDLKAIFVDEVDDTIYILTQTSLFKHPLTQAN